MKDNKAKIMQEMRMLMYNLKIFQAMKKKKKI